ncbi:hypothetical protein OA57_11115 [Chelonobacter oris]|uniref:histidine kinase n=1 Tax=Chelonobacter oris TaxID=505317 RepID=A0A0A3AJQ8_9PAST|nr:ATP-binding protein [Chelonobacter oris]KGQ69556.1 hypothetical protein OA57_11115 [Chelonobacter oris]
MKILNKKPESKIVDKLRQALRFSTILTIIVGLTGLLSWYQQNRQVNYILENYLPQDKLIFKLEDGFNAFINDFNHLTNVNSNISRTKIHQKLLDKVNNIQYLAGNISDEDSKIRLLEQSEELSKILSIMDRNIYKTILLKQKMNELNTKIDWLHDDFNSEALSLIQEINWQQSSIFESYSNNKNPMNNELDKLQLELQHIHNLSYIKENLRSELLTLLNADPNNYNKNHSFSDSIADLKKILNDRYIDNYPSIVTLHQLLNVFFELLSEEDGVPFVFSQYQESKQEFNQIIKEKDILLDKAKEIVGKQVSINYTNLNLLNESLKKLTYISGGLILMSIIFSLLFLYFFNKTYIKGNLIKRFTALSRSVESLSQGNLTTQITVDGNDEITRIAKFLQIFLKMTQERSEIEQNLRDTQDELIQSAKLAMVGKTMTILAHEINQPLNALSIYLFNINKLIHKKEDNTKVHEQLNRMALLIERINYIIKQLRQFTKRSDSNNTLAEFNLKESIMTAWNLLKLQHKIENARLDIQGESTVLADAIRIEQVFVNLFSNALEACHSVVPHLVIEIRREVNITQVFVTDNGIGWSLLHAEHLLKPFMTTKKMGLGLGLSVCQTILKQCNGELYIASTLDKHAQIILIFQNSVAQNDSE